MPLRRDKVIHYRRAVWLQGGPTLESYTRQATLALPTAEDRTVERGEDHFIRCLASRRRQAGGIFLHLTSDTPGEAATTVPKALNQPDVNVGESPAPEDAEYMDGDAFVFIRDDHVVFCAGQMREGSIQYFLAKLFGLAELGENATKFGFKKIADAEKVAMIEELGVREIRLNASVYNAVAHYIQRRDQPVGILRSAARAVASLFTDEGDRDDNLLLEVILHADGRVQRNPELGYERIKEIAEQVVESEEDGDRYTIVTLDGQKITPGKIVLHKAVSLPASGKTVSREPTWNELLAYYQHLDGEHMIAE